MVMSLATSQDGLVSQVGFLALTLYFVRIPLMGL